MKLVVFGASGQVGSRLVEQASARGHDVVAIVRPTAQAAFSPRVRVLRGEVLDEGFVVQALEGAECVASGLGLRRGSRLPWSRLLSPPDLTSQATGRIVGAMAKRGLRRLSIISAAGVGDSASALDVFTRFLVRAGQVGVAYRDLERTETLLRESSLDWQAVRPTTLVNRRGKGARIGTRYGLFDAVSRDDVAAFMLEELEKPAFSARTPLVTGR